MRSLSFRRPRFQPEWIPTDSNAASGSIESMKVGLKYGGPTDTVPRCSASESSGASVPANTVAAAVTSSTLLNSRKDSRAPSSNPASDFSSGARQAYSDSAPPIMMMRNASSSVQLLNSPRLSVTARECTSAVPTSQGMKEAFSTGSQNQKPPQPS